MQAVHSAGDRTPPPPVVVVVVATCRCSVVDSVV